MILLQFIVVLLIGTYATTGLKSNDNDIAWVSSQKECDDYQCYLPNVQCIVCLFMILAEQFLGCIFLKIKLYSNDQYFRVQ